MASEETKNIRFGEVLCALGLVNDEQLAESLNLVEQASIPLGRVLVMSQLLTEKQLNLALKLKPMIRGGLPLPVARHACQIAQTDNIDLSEALSRAGWSSAPLSLQQGTRLGSLFVDAGLITPTQLEDATSAGYESGLSLGRMMISLGFISHPTLAKALNLQLAVREGRMTYEEAICALSPLIKEEGTQPSETSSHTQPTPALAPPAPSSSSALPPNEGAVEPPEPPSTIAEQRSRNQRRITQSLQPNALRPSTKKTVRLGELLMLSGILTEADIMSTLEMGFSRQQSLGDILIETGLITWEILDLALELQRKVTRGLISIHAATDTLRYAATTGGVPANEGEMPAQPMKEVMRIGDLLKMCGLIQDADIDNAVELSTRFPSIIGKMLVVSGAIDDATLHAALRCQFLLKHNLLTESDAVRVMQFAQEKQISLDDAIDELDLRVPARGGISAPMV